MNMLVNPGFESPAQSTIGDNYPIASPINGWTITPSASFNIVKVNGTLYSGGPNNPVDGTQYADITSSAGSINQSFTLPCPSTLTFRGSFSSREPNNYVNWTGVINIVSSANATVATSSSRNFTSADAAEDQVWYTLSGTVSLAPGTYTYQAYMGDFGNFDAAFLCSSNCPLPVKLYSFDVTEEDCEFTLSWESKSEENLEEYGVEISEDGMNFNFIRSLSPHGTNKPYSFTADAPEGLTYYRLKMTDFDQSVQYSQIVSVEKKCHKEDPVVYPNPVGDQLKVFMPEGLGKEPVSLYLYNSLGALIIEEEYTDDMRVIDTKKLSQGIYYLTLYYNDIFKSYKIIK